MSKFKGTLGPWRIGTPGPNGCYTIGTERGLMTAMIAHSIYELGQAEEANANARLIAAAPELLEALQDLVDYVDEMHRIGHIQRPNQSSVAMAAIIKALYEKLPRTTPTSCS